MVVASMVNNLRNDPRTDGNPRETRTTKSNGTSCGGGFGGGVAAGVSRALRSAFDSLYNNMTEMSVN